MPGRPPAAWDAPAPGWEAAFAQVPRAAFLPDLVWPYDMARRTTVAVDRALDPSGWQEYAEADVPIVTQWDDGEHAGREPGRVSTSSASMPSVVAGMLDDLRVEPGRRVLEVGTGTGWNAALLCHRLGDANVTSVEVDPVVAARARAALDRAGYRPALVVGDGFAGHPAGAPYDRVVATCGLREIPYAWVAQTAPGGLVVAPWGTHFDNGDAVVRLEVADGRAEGRFTRPVEFMKMRSQRTAVRHAEHVPPQGTAGAEESATMLSAEELLPAAFVLGLRVPHCVQAVAGKRGDTRPIWYYSRTDRSWAVAVLRDGGRENAVWQSGPRRLWDETEAAVRWWRARGRPGLDRFGLSVDPAGTRVWLDRPEDEVTPGRA
ncbi:methyltransferase domain-containing protein [Actinacidiphila yeochonensis]|uniref:methyltransferase domain-containing protein n=1 Tax=Actinacidiphila yeochonensis TaxID=89050 RepID=UPI001E4F48DC|nr:methyltransferase domain-containing protein [Actinacidiphila yeochonensis]